MNKSSKNKLPNRKKKRDKKKSYEANKLGVAKVEKAFRNEEASAPMPTNKLTSLEGKNERDLINKNNSKIVASLLGKHYE